MEILFFINFLVLIAVFAYLLINLFRYHRDKEIGKAADSFFIISIPYSILSVLFFLWSFDLLKYAQMDFLLIHSMVIFIQTLVLFKIFYYISKNKILLYTLFFYVFSFFSLVYSYFYFLNFFLITSFLLMLIISMNLAFRHPNFKNAGIFGISYALFSLIFQFLVLFLNLEPYLFNLASGLVFLIFLFVFFRDFKRNPVESKSILKRKSKKKSYMLLFLKSFIFIIVVANLIFIGTVVIHEFGHFALSKIYACEHVKIIYEGGSPYTEALCKSPLTQKILLLGGFLPFLIAVFLFIFAGKLMKHISVLITGFNLVVLYKDFVGLGLSNNLIIFFILSGIIILVTGIMLLAKSSTVEYVNII